MRFLTYGQIERRVEKMTDALDRQLIAGVLSQRDYDAALSDLSRWTDHQVQWRASDA